MNNALLVVAGAGVGLLLALAWQHRASASRAWLLALPAVGTLLYVLLRQRAAPPLPPVLPPDPEPEDHVQDIPVETEADPAAPLDPPDVPDDDLLRWLEQRARRRTDTSE